MIIYKLGFKLDKVHLILRTMEISISLILFSKC